MIKLKNTYVFYFVIISYILINAYVLLFAKDMFYLFNLLPFAILIVLLAIFDIEKIMYVMVFSTPLAISLKELGYDQGLNLSLPAEPLMIGITLIYFLINAARSMPEPGLRMIVKAFMQNFQEELLL